MSVSALNPADFRDPKIFILKYLAELAGPPRTRPPIETEEIRSEKIIERGFPFGYLGRPPLEIFPKVPAGPKPPEHLIQPVQPVPMLRLSDTFGKQRRPFREPELEPGQHIDIYV